MIGEGDRDDSTEMIAQRLALLEQTRRHFFSRCFVGLGWDRFWQLVGRREPLGCDRGPKRKPSRAQGSTLQSQGQASHLSVHGRRTQPVRDLAPPAQARTFPWATHTRLLLEDKRFAFMERFTKTKPKLLGPTRKFSQHGQAGTWVSEVFPQMATVVDQLSLVHSVVAENFNHAPAKLFCNTGSSRFGRPSMGAWLGYGLGSESKDLPAFVVSPLGLQGLDGRCFYLGEWIPPNGLPGSRVSSIRRTDPEFSQPQGCVAGASGCTVERHP